ncbi:MAG: efflux RND transporter periplasmic adaptor subunit [Limnospira sp.]
MSHPSSTESSAQNSNQTSVEVNDSPESAVREPESEFRSNPGWLQVILTIFLALGVGFVGGQWWKATQTATPSQEAGPSEAPRGVPVRLARVETDNFQDASEFVGTLEATRSAELKPEIDGRVTRIFVESGDRVTQGQAIARLRSDDLEAQLRQAQANLIRTQARVAELEAGSRPEEIAEAQARVVESQARLSDAESGSLLAEINQAQAQIDASQASAALAAKRVNRFEELTTAGAISRDEFDTLVSEQETAQANLRAAQRRLEQLQKNRQAEISLREAEVEQARQVLRRLENGTRREEIDQAQAQVAEAAARVRQLEVQFAESAVEAPFTGVIGDVTVKEGDFITKGDPLTTLTENDRLELRLPIPLERKSDLEMGLTVRMGDARGNNLGTGRISFISPTVNQNSQTILAKATFPNPDGALRDGQFVRAQIIWNEKPGVVVIPMTAVQFLGDERFVFLAEGGENPTAKKQVIRLGMIRGDRAEVLEGLRPGEKLVVSGFQKLSEGTPIQPKN